MSKLKKTNVLKGEDGKLWNRVARSATPLSDAERNWATQFSILMDDEGDTKTSLPPVFKKLKAEQPSVPQAPSKTVKASTPHLPHPIDEPVVRKLAKGRQKIDARIDLHGMTQDRARQSLLDFLQLSRAANHRIVLVITGKGNLGTGILKQRVPDWLSMPPMFDLVNGFRLSHSSHGGEGALYVRLRRSPNRRSRG